MVIIVIAVMAIMMTVAVQTVEFQVKREREAELIFRGEQYVEGIRLYRQKYGRYPMRMKELWEANPKVLRRKWTDPITGSEEWGLVFLGQGGQELGGARGRAPGNRPGTAGQIGQPVETPAIGDPTPAPEGGSLGRGGGEKVGPIIGVHSLSTDESIKVYEGRNSYDEWKFVFQEDQAQGRQAGGGSNQDPDTPWGMPPTPGPGGGPGGGGPGGGGPGGGGGSGGPGDPNPTPPWPPRPQPTGTPRY